MENRISPAFELLQKDDSDDLRNLLEENPSVSEVTDAGGVSLLMHAIYRGRLDLAGLISGKKKVLDIFEAAALGRQDRLQTCLDEDGIGGMSIDSHSSDGFTALHFACFFRQPEAALLLIERGAAVDAVALNPTGVMPLHSAASARNLQAARVLLEHGAPVNARQQGGWVPLHAAAQNGDRPMVELLLEHHADPKLVNDQGKSSAFVAREKGHPEIAALLEKAAKALILID